MLRTVLRGHRAFVLAVALGACGAGRGPHPRVERCFEGHVGPQPGGTVASGGSPTIDRETLARVMFTSSDAVSRCYWELAKDKRGKVQVELELQPDGRVGRSRIRGTTMGAPALEACVGTAVCGLRFPPPLTDQPFGIRWTYSFMPVQWQVAFEDIGPNESPRPAPLCLVHDPGHALFARLDAGSDPPVDQTRWRAEIEARVGAQIPGLTRCLRRHLAQSPPDPEVALALELVVHGWVSRGAYQFAFPPSPELDRCMQQAICAVRGAGQPGMAKGGNLVARVGVRFNLFVGEESRPEVR